MRRTILWLTMVGLMLMAVTGRSWAVSEVDSDTLLGLNAGAVLPAGEYHDTFIGAEAGRRNTSGYNNTFVGRLAGAFTTTGYNNSFFGEEAGQNNTTGNNNTFMGTAAGLYNTASDNTFMGSGAGYLNSSGSKNTFLGGSAGGNNTNGGANTFIGKDSGLSNTGGNYNSFIGCQAGYYNTTGSYNIFLGMDAGQYSTTGSHNSFIGPVAGASNTTGDGNVFLGYAAGLSETGSNKLYIDNCYSGASCNDPLIYGEFDNRILTLDGALGIGTRPSYGIDVSGTGLSESQLHFSLNGTDTGGWVTSVADNNFWLSSGAVWDQAGGGWVQKSSDQKAVMAGSGPAGYRVLTRKDCPVGAYNLPTARMTIDYSGNVGFGVTPAYPLQMASGARVTVGGVWTDASSRDYKEDIEELTAAAAMSALQGLNPVTFKYKAAADERHVGFIAEDVPELVASSDRKGMSPMDVVAVLTKALQEQNKVVASQQEAIQEQQRAIQEQEQANQEFMQQLKALQAEVNSLRQSAADGRLARLAK
jgi:hypothetical protein